MKAMENATHAVPPEEVMAYLDGGLGMEDAVAVAAHLRECAECAALAEELGGVSRELRAWTVGVAPASLQREVRRAVRGNARARRRRRVGRRVWVWGGAIAGIAVVAGLLMLPTKPQHKRLASLPEQREMLDLARPDESIVQSRNAGVAGMESDNRNFAALSQIAPGAAAPTPPPTSMKADRFRGGVERVDTNPRRPMIARTASLTVLVKNVVDARAALEAAMTREQGYAAQLTFNTPDDGARSLQASLRVPAEQLDSALHALRELGRVEEESQSGEEVTAEHADLVARLTNAREEEARLRALLAQRTGKIEDVLQVEEEIARVRGEIEQMEAGQKGLEHRVDFASVDLKLVEEYAAKLGSPAEGTGTTLRNALVAGLRNARASLLGLLVFVEEYGPILVIWGALLGIPGWLVWRRYRRARASVG